MKILKKAFAFLILDICVLFIIEANISDPEKNSNQQQISKTIVTQEDKIDSIIIAAIRKDHLPGLSITISKDNKTVFQKAYGFSDFENNVPASVQSVYRIGSVSKTMTAVIIMSLFEKGLLNLDDPIQKYCPHFPEQKAPITIKQLLSHQSGIRNYSNEHFMEEYYSINRYPTSCDAISVFKNDTLMAVPGSRYLYTSYGYVLLGCLIENITGLTYEEALQKYVTNPAGMGQTTLDYPEKLIPFRVKPYEKNKDGSLKNARPVDLSNKFPAGGILSTSADMVRFGNALLNNKLLHKTTLDLMWTEQLTNSGKTTGYGLGWNTPEDRNEIFHGGASAGATAYIYILKKEKIVISFLTNTENWGDQRRKLAKDISNVLSR
ncbi:MAG: beta-lactamase family protein [Bacteroidetes bacterium]|nr:beta-lactamase family protein [Bacteroidota bacterium]